MIRTRCLAAAAALLSAFLPAAPAQVIPRKAPDYAINLVGGKSLSLSQYKGKSVVMVFFLTYCPHCQKAIGILSKAQAEYGARGLQVVASAVDEGGRVALPGFLRNFSPAFPTGYSTGASAIAFMQHPADKVPYMPLLAFIDRQGMVRAQLEGPDLERFGDKEEQELRKQIEALLNVTTPKSAPKKGTMAGK